MSELVYKLEQALEQIILLTEHPHRDNFDSLDKIAWLSKEAIDSIPTQADHDELCGLCKLIIKVWPNYDSRDSNKACSCKN
jgi:hypothetical protein